jgi:hypothetical protein
MTSGEGKVAWNAHQQAKIYSFTRKPEGCQTKQLLAHPDMELPISRLF